MAHPSADRPVALVTGSSRGIGRGIAIRLAADGFVVVLNGVKPLDPQNPRKGAFEVKETIEAAGNDAEFFRADVSCSKDRTALIEFIEERFGRLDLLINNAGIEPESMDFLDSTEERFDNVFAINLRGPWFLTQQLAKRMIGWLAEGRIPKARICFITSVQGYVATGGAEYCMTKAALGMAAKTFAARLGEHDIPVIEISPGVIHSDMADKHMEAIDKQIAAGRLVTSRWGTPQDVAGLVAAFGRGDLDYCTGERIEVGGGLGMPRWYTRTPQTPRA